MTDEVVAVFPVFAASALVDHVHVFQYPLRRCGQPYESSRMRLFVTDGKALHGAEGDGKETAVVSEKDVIRTTSRLTMRCTLDTFGSASFRNGEDVNSESGSFADSVVAGRRYNYTLTSQPFVPRSEYMVACISPNGIHITPVHTVQQMTPDLTSIAAGSHPPPGSPSSSSLSPSTQVGGVMRGTQEIDTAVSAVTSGAYRVPEAHCTVQTSPIVAGLASSNRLQRELYRQRSAALNADAASAVEMRVYDLRTRESCAMRRWLLSTTFESADVHGGERAGVAAAVDAYFPPEILISGGITGGEAANEAVIIHAFANRQPLMMQIQQLIGRCQVLPLRLILSNAVAPRVAVVRRGGGVAGGGDSGASHTVTEAQVVGCLRSCALFLHGVWVARRSARFQGSAAALREVVLVHFYLSPDATVRRGTLNALISSSSVTRRMLKDVLQSVAVLCSSVLGDRVWRLRHVSADAATRENSITLFTRCFPAEAAAQDEQWRKLTQLVRGHLSYLQSGRVPPYLFLGGPLATSSGEGGGGSAGTADALSVGGGRSQEATNPAADTRGENGAGFSVVELGPIQQYIRTLFAEYGVLNKQRAKELVLRGREVHYPAASNAMLSAALQSCVQPFTSSTWVLKTLGEPMVDSYRPLILQVVLQLQTFGIRALQVRVQELVRERDLSATPVVHTMQTANGNGSMDPNDPAEQMQEEGPPMKVIQRVVSEVAEYKQGERLWHLKSGNAMQ